MKTETEEIDKLAAEQAAQWQKMIRDSEPYAEFVRDGRLEWLQQNVFIPMEHEMMLMIRGLDFVPNSLAQLGNIKGQLETLDRISSRILSRIQEGKDARHKLEELANSTPMNGNE